MGVQETIARLKGEIPQHVSLVVAVKYARPGQISELINAGATDFGFNQYPQLKEVGPILPPHIRKHFIGTLQSNKVRKVLESKVYLIQSVDSQELAERINRISGELGIKQNILLQVNTDAGKEAGIPFSRLEHCASYIDSQLPYVSLKGLMTIPPAVENTEDVRSYFRTMNQHYAALSKKLRRNLEYLSMGMSSDYAVAVQEGATMVRIGSMIFV